MGTPCDDEVSHDQTEINGATEHQDEHEEDFCSPSVLVNVRIPFP